MGDANSREIEIATKMSDQKLPSRYCFKQSLGVGGMGEVYLADDTALRRAVAIKTIRPDLCRDPEVRKRIERECLLHAKVGAHPHIVTLFDKLEEGDRINLVMEYVEGETLQGMLERCQKEHTAPDLREALTIASQVLEALSRIHAHGIVHRDIKPSNIILSRDDGGPVCAKLMDFGIARAQDDELGSRLTQAAGSGPGTPLYMAPEQIDPETFGAASPATDVYAMGVMIYQMTSGEPPFTGTITQIFNGHLRGTPPSLRDRARGRVPEALVEIIECALAKRPAERFPSAKVFREELLRAMSDAPSAPPADGHATLPSAAVADAGRTLRASEAVPAAENAGGTMLSGAAVSGVSVRRKRRAVKWIVLVVVLIAAAVTGWLVLPALLKGKEEASAKDSVIEKPAAEAPVEKSTPPPGPPAANTPEPPAPVANTTPASTAPDAAAALPEGFGALAAPPDGAPAPAAASAPAPPPASSGGSAIAIVEQRLQQPQPEEPAAVQPTTPAASEPPKTVAPREPKPVKSEPKPAKKTPEAKKDEPRAAAPATTTAPDAGNAWKEISVESHKVN